MKITERQRRFISEYIKTGKAYTAALNAGYSKKYAQKSSHLLLENKGIKSELDKQLEKLKSERVADETEVMEFLTAVMRGEVAEPTLVLDGNGFQRVADLRTPVPQRRQAAVDLGKRYGMWTEKQQIEHVGAVVIVDDI